MHFEMYKNSFVSESSIVDIMIRQQNYSAIQISQKCTEK